MMVRGTLQVVTLLAYSSLLLGCKAEALNESAPASPEPSESTPLLAGRFTAELGPLQLSLSVDQYGNISLTPAFVPRARLSLGPVSFSVGVEETFRLTEQLPYHLFILRRTQDGNIERSEYEIGREFTLSFDRTQHVNQIQGRNGSLIISIEDEPVLQQPTRVSPEFSAADSEEGVEIETPVEDEPEEKEPAPTTPYEQPEAPVVRPYRWPPSDSPSYPERRTWRTEVAPTPRLVPSQGVTLSITIIGDGNNVSIEETWEPGSADLGQQCLTHSQSDYGFRLTAGTGAVILIRGNHNEIHIPKILRARVRVIDRGYDNSW